MENRKELIKKFREQVANGKYASRYVLLAYAFLRGVPYVALERVINEDHPSFGKDGRESFLSWLKYGISMRICEAQFTGKTIYELRKEGKEDEAQALIESKRAFQKPLEEEIWNWLQDKYKSSKDEAAA